MKEQYPQQGRNCFCIVISANLNESEIRLSLPAPDVWVHTSVFAGTLPRKRGAVRSRQMSKPFE